MRAERTWTPGTTAWVLALAAFFGVFLLYPTGYMLREAFVVDGHLTIRHFGALLTNPVAYQAFANSFWIATLTTVLTTLITLPLAHALTRYEFPGRTWLNGLLILPMILPPFVGAIGLKQLFARFGSVNLFFIQIGWMDPAQPVDWFGGSGLWGVVILQTLSLYPILYLNLSAALANIDPAMREAAQNLGAGSWRLFRTVTLPLILPGWFAGAIIVFLWAFTDLGTPLIFGVSQVVPVQIFDSLTELNTNPMGFVMVVAVLVLSLAGFLASKRLLTRQGYAMIARGHTAGAQERASRGRTLVLWSVAGAFVTLALLPHLGVALESVSGKWFLSVLPEELTLANYAELGARDGVGGTIRQSLFYSTLSAGLDLVLGTAIAWLLTRRKLPFAGVLDALAMLPLAVPGLVIAFGYVAAFDVKLAWVNPRENPTLLLVISYAVRRLPYIVRSAYAGFQQTHVALEEASANLGATPWRTLRKITLPLVMANLIAGTILTFSLAMLEVSDGLILAMKEKFYPITKTIWVLLGRVEPNSAGVACALGMVGMLILGGSLLIAGRLMGRKVGQLFRA